MPPQHWQSATARELCQITGTHDPHSAVQQLAQALLADAEVAVPPVNLLLIGSFQKIRDIQEAVMPHAGRLLPDGANYLIPSFQRHPHVIQDMVTGVFEAGQEEEYLCDIAAAELLLPERLFRPLVMDLGCHLNAVIELGHIFQASREATARKLVEMNLWPCAFAIWHLSYKDSEAQINQQLTLGGPEWALPEKKLRVRYAVSNQLFGHYLHRNLAAPQDGCLMRCFKEGGVVCDEEHLTLQNRDVTFYVMAVARNYTDKSGPTRDVFALLLSDGLTRSAQESQYEAWTLFEE